MDISHPFEKKIIFQTFGFHISFVGCIISLFAALLGDTGDTGFYGFLRCQATVSLRQWFAEPASSSLHDMLKALAALRRFPNPV